MGDPIELVAASAVLLPSAPHAEEAGLPLTLAAGKSSVGHTEPAAGLVGIYHALHTMQSSMVQPILHFRQVRYCWLRFTARMTCTFSMLFGPRGPDTIAV